MSGERTILICDDDATIRRLIRMVLGADGFAFRETADVHTALAALQESPPDLVILDVNVPGDGGGLGVLAHVRASPALSRTRVLLVTGISQARDDDWGRSVGADNHLLKPFDLQGLRDAVSGLLADA